MYILCYRVMTLSNGIIINRMRKEWIRRAKDYYIFLMCLRSLLVTSTLPALNAVAKRIPEQK
jgi:hypothetical protein